MSFDVIHVGSDGRKRYRVRRGGRGIFYVNALALGPDEAGVLTRWLEARGRTDEALELRLARAGRHS